MKKILDDIIQALAERQNDLCNLPITGETLAKREENLTSRNIIFEIIANENNR
jgi:hypothetical protein